jgi:beta-phosphoglucomutase-like phosphatase (HAD superfamily)
MQVIEGILFDPVGSLAEFAVEEFEAIAIRMSGPGPGAGASGSQAYWDVVNLLEARGWPLDARERAMIEHYELQAVDRSCVYDDAAPALSDLESLGVRLIVASSLSEAALQRFLERSSLRDRFAECWSRDTAGGVRRAPVTQALAASALAPDRTMFLADTAAGLHTAKQAGVNAILMMNDPDEAMKLTAYDPAGGIVSLHELPDFVRLVAAEHERLQVP